MTVINVIKNNIHLLACVRDGWASRRVNVQESQLRNTKLRLKTVYNNSVTISSPRPICLIRGSELPELGRSVYTSI
jgi:hypothetical protein